MELKLPSYLASRHICMHACMNARCEGIGWDRIKQDKISIRPKQILKVLSVFRSCMVSVWVGVGLGWGWFGFLFRVF